MAVYMDENGKIWREPTEVSPYADVEEPVRTLLLDSRGVNGTVQLLKLYELIGKYLGEAEAS